MTDNEIARRRISALLDEIEASQRALGMPAAQASDREAYDTVCRIQRRAAAAQPTKEAAE